MIRLAAFRWLGKNFSSLLLAFILSLVVWISAVVTADPNEVMTLRLIDIEKVGQASDLLLVGDAQDQVRLTLRAPRSILQQVSKDTSLVKAWIDLSGYGPGTHVVEVKIQVDISPVRFERIEPAEIELTLDKLVTKDLPVDLQINGELPLGYKKDIPRVQPETVRVSGAESIVAQVAQTRVELDISGAIATIDRNLPVEPFDSSGNLVTDVTILPKSVQVIQPIDLLGGFKNVVVKVVTTGQVANGYRLTNISVSPPTVTLFSDNPVIVDEVPGFVETLPVDLTGLNDDVEMDIGLNLPAGISLVREPSVFVQVSVAAIEGSMTISVPVGVIGLPPELQALISPPTVDIIVAGPLNVLDTLGPDDFMVVLDLSGLPAGVYQRAPQVDQFPDQVRIQTILPETVEVTIGPAPTPTISTTPGSVPIPTLALTPTVTSQP